MCFNSLLLVGLLGALSPSATLAATDSDRDGLPNTFERDWTLTSPTRRDSDGDGLPDGSEDPDRDRLTNRAGVYCRHAAASLGHRP